MRDLVINHLVNVSTHPNNWMKDRHPTKEDAIKQLETILANEAVYRKELDTKSDAELLKLYRLSKYENILE